MFPRRVLIIISFWSLLALRAGARNFIVDIPPPTLLKETQNADFVVYGHLENAQKPKDPEKDRGSTDFILENVLKEHAFLKDKKRLTIDRSIDPANFNKKILVFAVVHRGLPDYFRGVFEANPGTLLKYAQGMLARKDRPEVERLRFAFDYLDNKDVEVARDAHSVFHHASYKVQAEAAKSLSADKIVALLQSDDAGQRDATLYGILLGYTGQQKRLPKLWERVRDAERKRISGVSGAMIGILLLEPAEIDNIVERLLDQERDFTVRYAALMALRHMLEHETGVKKEVVEKALVKLVADPEMADFAADDLRKWKCWNATSRVLPWYHAPSHKGPVIRRAILKFALQSPTDEARTLVAAERKRDAEYVKDVEELLNLEETPEKK